MRDVGAVVVSQAAVHGATSDRHPCLTRIQRATCDSTQLANALNSTLSIREIAQPMPFKASAKRAKMN